jgi:hypothetical protein
MSDTVQQDQYDPDEVKSIISGSNLPPANPYLTKKSEEEEDEEEEEFTPSPNEYIAEFENPTEETDED